MAHYKQEAKEAKHAKMKRMGLHSEKSSGKHFDDVHPYDGVPQLNTDTPSGLAPVGKQRFRRGGKVAHAEGKAAKHHLGHKPRSKFAGGSPQKGLVGDDPFTSTFKSAGKTMMSPTSSSVTPTSPTVTKPVTTTPPPRPTNLGGNDSIGMDADQAQKFMDQKKHGGRIHKAFGGPMAPMSPSAKKKRVAALAMRKKKAGLPYAPPSVAGMGALLPHKKGGAVSSHPDVAEDKKLIKSMVKGEALKHRQEKCWGGRTKRNKYSTGGGPYDRYSEGWSEASPTTESLLGREGSRERQMWDWTASEPNALKRLGKGLTAIAAQPVAAAMDAYNRRGTTSDDMQPHKNGGRIKRKAGGKTTINLIVDAGQKQPRGMAPMPAGGAPAIPPQLLAAMAGGAGGPPPGAGGPPPGAMPPGAGIAGAGGGLGAGPAMNVGRPGMTPPTPPMRKEGGRVGGKAPQAAMPTKQEHDYGSGSGLGRLEKRKWYPK